MYGVDAPWLWRGQANASFNLEPGMHTRVRANSTLDDAHVVDFTQGLLDAARAAELDRHEETRLPDLALLALLQHHRADLTTNAAIVGIAFFAIVMWFGARDRATIPA